MSGWTNRGKKLVLDYYFRRQGTLPTNFYVALVDSSVVPSGITNVLGDLGQVPAGNGYTSGGVSLTPGVTDFDYMNEDDANYLARSQIKDVVWTASGGNLPVSGNGARYAVLTDDNATVGSRQVFFFWDLSSNRIVSSGQALTLQDLEFRIDE